MGIFYYIPTKCIGKAYADIHPGSHPPEFMGSSLARGNRVFHCSLCMIVLRCVKGQVSQSVVSFPFVVVKCCVFLLLYYTVYLFLGVANKDILRMLQEGETRMPAVNCTKTKIFSSLLLFKDKL